MKPTCSKNTNYTSERLKLHKPLSIPPKCAGRLIIPFLIVFILICNVTATNKQTDRLNRGVIVLKTSESNAFISWRLLNTDPEHVTFDIFRSTSSGEKIKLNEKPVCNTTFFCVSIPCVPAWV